MIHCITQYFFRFKFLYSYSNYNRVTTSTIQSDTRTLKFRFAPTCIHTSMYNRRIIYIYIFSVFSRIHYTIMSLSYIIYFVIMYMIHIIQALHIINMYKFAFKRTFASLFVNFINTKFILLIQLFFPVSILMFSYY